MTLLLILISTKALWVNRYKNMICRSKYLVRVSNFSQFELLSFMRNETYILLYWQIALYVCRGVVASELLQCVQHLWFVQHKNLTWISTLTGLLLQLQHASLFKQSCYLVSFSPKISMYNQGCYCCMQYICMVCLTQHYDMNLTDETSIKTVYMVTREYLRTLQQHTWVQWALLQHSYAISNIQLPIIQYIFHLSPPTQ